MDAVKLELTKNQRDALDLLMDNEHTSIGFWGGAWWGKSFLWAIWLWLMCVRFPWVRYALARDTIKNAKATTVKSLWKFYSIYNIPERFQWKMNEQKSTITFRNWSEIVLVECWFMPSDSYYNRFGSLEITWAFIEESAECPLEWVQMLSTRVWRQLNDKYWILWKVLETFNPNPWHVYDRFYLGKWWEKSVFLPSLATSNKFIDSWYIENLKNSSESIRNRLLKWLWIFDDNVRMMYKSKDIDDLRTNEQKDWKYYIVCDVARFWVDTTRISLWKGNTRLNVRTYAKSSIREVKESILNIAAQYDVDHRDIIIDADWVWWWVVDEIDYSTGFVNNSRPIETGVQENYANLKSQCAFELRRKLENHELAIAWEHLNADSDYELLRKDLLNVYIDEKSVDAKTRIETKEKFKERTGHSPDLLDTMIMRMLPYLRWDEWTDYATNYLSSIVRNG